MANHNLSRLNEDVKRELSALLREIKDPRVTKSFVSISSCKITSDLSFCKVYVTVLENGKEAIEGLKKASGFLKKQLALRVKMRKMPEFIFELDESLDYYRHIESILENLPKTKSNDIDTSENND